MKNKGFTLIELLAVIVLLAVITTVVVTSAYSLIKNNNEKHYDLLIDEIEHAAKLYLNDNYENYIIGRESKYLSVKVLEDNSCTSMYVNIEDLVKANLLDEKSLKDPRDNSDISKKSAKVYYRNGEMIIDNNLEDEKTTGEMIGCNYITDNYFTVPNTSSFVIFNNQTWRILRVNKDGSIRIVINDNIGTSAFGKDETATYDNSLALATLQYWYLYDVSSIAKELTREASLTLIKQSEYNTIKNYTNSEETWLISSDNKGITSLGVAGNNTKTATLKPIIELKPTVNYVAGNGTADNPYLIR